VAGYDHTITLPGRTARSEAVVVYEVHDILEVSPGLEGSEHIKQEIKKLEEKAAKYKEELVAARAKKGGEGRT
jgi:hypothetical protein